jgi:hypothetical protein
MNALYQNMEEKNNLNLIGITLKQFLSSSNINQHINGLIAIDQGFIRYVGRYS